MPRPTQCPTCQTMRPPNARFCPSCGLDFDAGPPVAAIGSTAGWVQPAAAPPSSLDISFWTAIKFGAGFVIGAGVVSIVIWVGVLLLVLLGLSLPAASFR